MTRLARGRLTTRMRPIEDVILLKQTRQDAISKILTRLKGGEVALEYHIRSIHGGQSEIQTLSMTSTQHQPQSADINHKDEQPIGFHETTKSPLPATPTTSPYPSPRTRSRKSSFTKIQIDRDKELDDDKQEQRLQSEYEEATPCIRDDENVSEDCYGGDEEPPEGVCFNKNEEKITISNTGSQHKPSIQDDMVQSVNNLRLNVNKKRIIGKMRKISITELNRRRRSSKHARYCKFAFYTAITLLSFLFLYLIYQNLFND